jgi:hypothetical protein
MAARFVARFVEDAAIVDNFQNEQAEALEVSNGVIRLVEDALAQVRPAHKHLQDLVNEAAAARADFDSRQARLETVLKDLKCGGDVCTIDDAADELNSRKEDMVIAQRVHEEFCEAYVAHLAAPRDEELVEALRAARERAMNQNRDRLPMDAADEVATYAELVLILSCKAQLLTRSYQHYKILFESASCLGYVPTRPEIAAYDERIMHIVNLRRRLATHRSGVFYDNDVYN